MGEAADSSFLLWIQYSGDEPHLPGLFFSIASL